MDKELYRFGKRELFLLAAILVVAAVFFLVNYTLYRKPAAFVEVSVVNEQSEKIVLETFDLSNDLEFSIVTDPITDGAPEGTNYLHIQNGEVWISEANCPNHDCIKKGKISRNGEMLVCIPHRLTVSIVSQ